MNSKLSTKGSPTDKYLIASVDRAIQLLFMLESGPLEMGVTELSRALGVQKSTVHNLLQTLLARDLVRKTDTGRYTLGFRLMPLGLACTERLDIRRISSPILNQLVNEAKEVVLLAVLSAGQITIVERIEPPRQVFMVPRFDYCNTFHSSGLGKVFLAFGPEDLFKKVMSRTLQRYTPNTLTEKELLHREIDKIRQQGYSVACDETIEGVTCIGAPILNAHGKIEAAVSVSGATSWLGKDEYEPMVRILREKAKMVSEQLGYRA
ncbi:IclR family transcriptional regulator [Pelosinus sp. sgz500959]|uniref:IclR family transcriptional regulator n=1 Tax=Pelosinus sp. sgz500959 TaxID=3242472 RepID=UPI003672A873